MIAAIVASALVGITACDLTTPDDGPPVTSDLECGAPGSPASACTLPIEQQARFEVKLVSTSCDAGGNKIRLLTPVATTLTSDACDEPAGKIWNFAGPFAAGSQIDFQIESILLPRPPSFRATGAYPRWNLSFEDGGDTDFNDIVMEVTAIPVP